MNQLLKPYKTLIRVQKNEIDTARKALANLWDKEAIFLNKMQRLDKELSSEKQKTTALNAPRLQQFFLHYWSKNRQTYQMAERAAQQVKIDIEQALNTLKQLFEIQKQYELILEQKETKITNAQKKAETQFFDEIALQHYKKT